MASSSGNKDEHTSLQNELIFLSKLLHHHKQKGKTTHAIHKDQQKLDKKHSQQKLSTHPPCKKNMVWRRAGTTTSHNVKNANINVHVHQSVDQRNMLSTKTMHSGKYAKVNSLTRRSPSSSTFSQSEAGNSTSSFRNEKQQMSPHSKTTKWIRPSATEHASNNLAKKSTSLLQNKKVVFKQWSSLENTSKSDIVNRPEIKKLNHQDKLRNQRNDSSPLSKSLKQTDKAGASGGIVNTTETKDSFPKDMSVELSPNSRYVWRKQGGKGLTRQIKAQGNGGNQKSTSTNRKRSDANLFVSVSPGSSKNTKAIGEEFPTRSPEKYLSCPLKRSVAVRTKYKLHLNSPTSVRSGKKLKNRKTVYSSPRLYRSPNVKKSKLLTQLSIKKTPKSATSKHRWVKAKESNPTSPGITKFSKLSDNTTLPADYRKSKFTWRKEQPKTKQVSMCGYKLINVAKASKSPQENYTPFMERRKKYVNSHTPVILRSRFKLHRTQSPAITPGVKTFETAKTPLGRLVNNKPSALFTIRKTRRKIVRKQVLKSPSVISHLIGDQGSEVTPVSMKIKNHDFKVHSSGKKLKRLRKSTNTSISSIFSVDNTPSTSFVIRRQSTSSRKLVAQQVLLRSIITSNQAKYKKHNMPTSAKRYCTYYNRFGKCSRGDKCPYLHDSEKVAVCTRFLRGNCKQTDGTCPFSHKISKDKMPVCSYFLRGICNRDNCPYLHVNVSRNAAICQDFLRGYCPAGDKCKKKHSLECPDYQRDGNCPRGRQCRLLHRQQQATKRKKQRTEDKSIKKPKSVACEDDVEPVNKLPSFISLKDEDSDWINTPNTSIQGQEGSVTPELLIRPTFTNH